MTKRERDTLIKELRSLLSSPAWTHICASLDESALNAAYKLGNGPSNESDSNFTRGAIWALKTMKQLPLNLLTQLDNDAALDTQDRRDL